MEVQLRELLDKIRAEGLDAAKSEAAEVLREAKKKAAILAEADHEARAIVEKARAEAAKAEESGRAALSQASRDFLISFRVQLEKLLAEAVKQETTDAYGPEILAEALPAVIKALASGGTDELSVLLPPAMLAGIEGRLPSLLSAELKKGVVLRPSPGLEAGFRIVEKNGAAYYDFSAETLAEIFASRLSSKLAETLRNAATGT